eukprot:SAG22_NODE_1837_length_3466_cov_6.911197_1_plen_248_part_10
MWPEEAPPPPPPFPPAPSPALLPCRALPAAQHRPRTMDRSSLAEKLPEGPVKGTAWAVHYDDLDGMAYYHNETSGETTWDMPQAVMSATSAPPRRRAIRTATREKKPGGMACCGTGKSEQAGKLPFKIPTDTPGDSPNRRKAKKVAAAVGGTTPQASPKKSPKRKTAAAERRGAEGVSGDRPVPIGDDDLLQAWTNGDFVKEPAAEETPAVGDDDGGGLKASSTSGGGEAGTPALRAPPPPRAAAAAA